MGSLGLPEMIFIFVLALLIFGPKKLPELGRTVGKGLAEFRKASGELKRTLNAEMALDENPAPPQLRPRRMDPAAPAAGTAEAATAAAAGIDGAAPAPVPEMRVPETAVPSSAPGRSEASAADPRPLDPH